MKSIVPLYEKEGLDMLIRNCSLQPSSRGYTYEENLIKQLQHSNIHVYVVKHDLSKLVYHICNNVSELLKYKSIIIYSINRFDDGSIVVKFIDTLNTFTGDVKSYEIGRRNFKFDELLQ